MVKQGDYLSFFMLNSQKNGLFKHDMNGKEKFPRKEVAQGVLVNATCVIPWAANWSLSNAISYLFMPMPRRSAKDHSVSNCFNRSNTDDAETFDGGNEVWREAMFNAQKRKTRTRLVAQLKKVRLDEDSKMRSVLWVRLALNANLIPRTEVLYDLDCWLAALNERGYTVIAKSLAKPNSRENSDCLTASQKSAVTGTATIKDLLSGQSSDVANWPFSNSWIFCPREGNIFAASNVKSLERNGDSGNMNASQKKLPNPKGPQPNTLTRSEQFDRRCGSEFMQQLLVCLRHEAGKKTSKYLEKKTTGDRLYRSLRRCDELVTHLSNYYKVDLNCSDATLKRALPCYVSFKLGRPRPSARKKSGRMKSRAKLF